MRGEAGEPEEFADRLEAMRQRSSDPGPTGGRRPDEALEELLVALEELRVAEEELRQQNEELDGDPPRARGGAPALPAALPLRARRLPAHRPERHRARGQPVGRRLLGVEPRFLAGKALVSFVAPEDRARFRAELGRWQSEPDPQEPRAPAPARARARRSTPRSPSPWPAAGRATPAIGFRWLVRDISAQRQLTDELRLREEAARRAAEASEAHSRHVQKLESIGVLAGGIAHDFNNLLHVVLGNADLARMQRPSDSPAREHLEEVVRATLRAADLTQQLLAYSGQGRGRDPPPRSLQRGARDGHPAAHRISKQATLAWELAPTCRRSAPTPPRSARS